MNWIKEHIEKAPSFDPFKAHIGVIEESCSSNPALCVETCKSLLEGICKTILANKQIDYSAINQFQGLVRQTIESILNTEDDYKDDLIELGRRIASIAQKLGEIRNNAGFSSHGMDVLNPRLTDTISTFTYKITDTIGGFILSSYLNNRTTSQDRRIHYRDCGDFNNYFDDLNPMELGVIRISASEALYNQDYQAYKESYYEYLNELEQGLEVEEQIEIQV